MAQFVEVLYTFQVLPLLHKFQAIDSKDIDVAGAVLAIHNPDFKCPEIIGD